MPEKDPTNYSLLTYAWVLLLATLGGAVNFIGKVREGVSRPWNFTEFIGEIITSAFAGIMTFYLCEWSGTPPLLTAALVGISGHMGSRAIFRLERWVERKLDGIGQ